MMLFYWFEKYFILFEKDMRGLFGRYKVIQSFRTNLGNCTITLSVNWNCKSCLSLFATHALWLLSSGISNKEENMLRVIDRMLFIGGSNSAAHQALELAHTELFTAKGGSRNEAVKVSVRNH